MSGGPGDRASRPRGGNFDASRSAPRKRPVQASASALSPQEETRPGLGCRLVAARILSAVLDARTSADALMDAGGGHPRFRQMEPRDQGLARAIVLTALRFHGTIERVLGRLIERPLPQNAAALRHLLHVGAAQVLFLQVPDSAAVDLAVAAAHLDPRNRRFAGLVNAVLRRLAREKDDAGLAPVAGENTPAWLRARLLAAYGADEAAAIAAAHLTPAPLDLTAKGDAAALAERLGGLLLPTGSVRLAALDGPVTALAGFAQGEWWVQDAAAALPARLLGDVAGRRVLDACAAPGGKTAQLVLAGGRVTALDISASRMRRLEGNLQRLGLLAETLVTDVGAFAPTELFDAVLLDAPCSSTGTIRRHPDVPHTKDAAAVEALAAVQARLLDETARLVAPNGRLVFSNCSLDPAEGEALVAAFLGRRPDFALDPVRPAELPGLAPSAFRAGLLRTTPAMLPHEDPRLAGLDGFFAARLTRV